MRTGWIHFETRQVWHFWLVDQTVCGFKGHKYPLAMLPPSNAPKRVCWRCRKILQRRGSIYA